MHCVFCSKCHEAKEANNYRTQFDLILFSFRFLSSGLLFNHTSCNLFSQSSLTAGSPLDSFWAQQRGPWGPRWWTSRPRWRGCCWCLGCAGCSTAAFPSAWNEIFVGWLFLAVVSFQNSNHTHIYLTGFFLQVNVLLRNHKTCKSKMSKEKKTQNIVFGRPTFFFFF